MKHHKLAFLLLIAIPCLSQSASAQWIGTDEPPVEPAKAQVSYLGSDVTKSTTPGGPSSVVRVYGEGYPTPPVYTPKPEHISALKLNPAQESALGKAFPDFVPWTLADYGTNVKYFPFSKRQMPYAISWDFNGKGIPINVIAGHDETQNHLVIFKPNGKEYNAIKREAGFVHTTGIPHTILPMLRMIKHRTAIRVLDEDNPAYYVLRHDAFAYFNVWISSGIPPERHPQLDGDNLIYYFHEGLFPIARTNIRDFRTNGDRSVNNEQKKDITPTPEIAAALSTFNKDFKIWTSSDYSPNSASAPPQYAIKHDLNGDGIEDMVVAGHDNDANLVMEVISGTDGFHVSPVGDSPPCYAKARERNAKLPLKPAHSLFLYKKGTDYAGLAPKATENLWEYRDTFLVGLRILNTCTKWRTGPEEAFESALQYGNWAPWTDKNKETLYVYGESEDQIYCPGGIDHCGFELIPPVESKGTKKEINRVMREHDQHQRSNEKH